MATGYLDNGDPYIDVDIPAFGQAVTLRCLIDTGFTGFLSVPLLQAFPLGLILSSTTNVALANGAVETKLVCLGLARLDGVQQIGIFMIENRGSDVLLGMGS